MKRCVWIVAHYAAPAQDLGGSSRHRSLARELGRHGWRVEVLAADTAHPSGTRRALPTSFWEPGESAHWNFVRVPEYMGNSRRRLLNMVLFALRVLRRSETSQLPKPDVVWGSTVHPLAAFAGWRLSRRFQVPFVLEIGDLWPETLIDMGLFSRHHPLAIALRKLEGKLCREASRIIVTMPRADAYLAETHGISPAKVIWISMGTEVENFPETGLSHHEDFEFRYFGSHGRANGLDAIIDGFAAAKGLTSASIKLTFVGDGAEKAQLIKRVEDLGLSNLVTFLDPVPKAQIPAVAADADALIMCVLPLELYRFGISMNKLFDYLAAGRPIVFAGDPVNNPVKDAQAGIVTPNVTADAIAAAMVEMAESPIETRQQWARRGRRHVSECYSYESLGAHLHEILSQAAIQ